MRLDKDGDNYVLAPGTLDEVKALEALVSRQVRVSALDPSRADPTPRARPAPRL